MKYDKYAFFGKTHLPIKSLVAPSMQQCIAGRNDGYFKSFGSNCRYYVGCVLRLLWEFDKIPGVSDDLKRICTKKSKDITVVQENKRWMQKDNQYWMTCTGVTIFDGAQCMLHRVY